VAVCVANGLPEAHSHTRTHTHTHTHTHTMYRVTGLQIKPSVKTHPIHTYAHTTHTHTHTNGKIIDIHDIIHPHPTNLASELVGLITRKDIATSRHASQKIKNSFLHVRSNYGHCKV